MKWLWLGHRFSDGLLYARALKGLDVFFSCDSVAGDFPDSKSYFLQKNTSNKLTSDDIQFIIDEYHTTINSYVSKGYNIFPYFIPDSSKKKLTLHSESSLFNARVFSSQLSRTAQMHLVESSGVRTPNWAIPNSLSWKKLTLDLNEPIIVQFNNTSSGLGTFCIKSETAYNEFCCSFGLPDIALKFIEGGIPCSAHLYITEYDIIVLPPSVQIIENSILAQNRDINTFSFKGNDFFQYNLKFENNKEIYNSLEAIGKVYQKIGVWGLIGIDYIMKDNLFYYNETNFRLQNSTALLSFLQPIGVSNIVQCLMPYEKIQFSNVKKGYQIFVNVPLLNLKSGYFEISGRWLGDISSEEHYMNNAAVMVLVNRYNYEMQTLRIIGFQKCLDDNGTISVFLHEFIERLVRQYGRVRKQVVKTCKL